MLQDGVPWEGDFEMWEGKERKQEWAKAEVDM